MPTPSPYSYDELGFTFYTPFFTQPHSACKTKWHPAQGLEQSLEVFVNNVVNIKQQIIA